LSSDGIGGREPMEEDFVAKLDVRALKSGDEEVIVEKNSKE